LSCRLALVECGTPISNWSQSVAQWVIGLGLSVRFDFQTSV